MRRWAGVRRSLPAAFTFPVTFPVTGEMSVVLSHMTGVGVLPEHVCRALRRLEYRDFGPKFTPILGCDPTFGPCVIWQKPSCDLSLN